MTEWDKDVPQEPIPVLISVERVEQKNFAQQMKDGEFAPQDAPPPWQPQRAPHTLLWYKDIEPVVDDQSLVGDLLAERGLSMIVGKSGSTKTFFALHLGLSVAAGAEMFGKEVKQGGVVYIAAEAGEAIKNRVVAWRLAHPEVALDIPFAVITAPVNFHTPQPAGNLYEVADVILAAIKDGTPISLVLVDTMARAIPGADENNAQDMTAFISNMDALRGMLPAAVALVHHHGKDEDRGARGHSSLFAAVDTEITIKHDKVTGIATAEVTKQRDLPTEGKIAYKLRTVDVGRADTGKPITSCVIEEVEGAVAAPKKPPTGQAKVGLDQLLNCLADQSELLPAASYIPAGARGVTLDQWQGYLAKAGIINMKGGYREQFKRIRVTLQERGFIGVWDEFVWLSHSVT